MIDDQKDGETSALFVGDHNESSPQDRSRRSLLKQATMLVGVISSAGVATRAYGADCACNKESGCACVDHVRCVCIGNNGPGKLIDETIVTPVHPDATATLPSSENEIVRGVIEDVGPADSVVRMNGGRVYSIRPTDLPGLKSGLEIQLEVPNQGPAILSPWKD